MTDVTLDDLTYFTDVLDQLYHLHQASPEGSSLYQITQEAGADIATLLDHLHYAAIDTAASFSETRT